MSELTRIQVLGRFAVRTADGEVPPADFGGRLSRRLLRLLAVRQGEVVTRGVLTAALWPERSPSDPEANLNVLVSRARRAVGDRDLIVTGDAGYALAGRCTVDAVRFLELASTGRARLEQGRADAALRQLTGALELWGEPLPEDA
ncbi:MAG: AfsR/SARP family transcriptional regulator, partial [Nitriliruptorales bacterium]